jgi:hypothetical protein
VFDVELAWGRRADDAGLVGVDFDVEPAGRIIGAGIAGDGDLEVEVGTGGGRQAADADRVERPRPQAEEGVAAVPDEVSRDVGGGRIAGVADARCDGEVVRTDVDVVGVEADDVPGDGGNGEDWLRRGDEDRNGDQPQQEKSSYGGEQPAAKAK